MFHNKENNKPTPFKSFELTRKRKIKKIKPSKTTIYKVVITNNKLKSKRILK